MIFSSKTFKEYITVERIRITISTYPKLVRNLLEPPVKGKLSSSFVIFFERDIRLSMSSLQNIIKYTNTKTLEFELNQ